MKLEDFENLTNAATPGPWDLIILENSCAYIGKSFNGPGTFADSVFIAACREMVPKMIKRLQLAERIIDSVDGHPFLKNDLVMSMFVREYRETELEQP